ncbi:hypothetical protein MRX96_003252 [Rhipicephalus microplus]
MELEGLKRALTSLDVHEAEVAQLVTDRHPQVKKYLSTEKPGIEHLFDAWQVGKGVNKKLLTTSKAEGCFVIRLWAKSIVKHLYFSMHHGGGDGGLAVAVWLSTLKHIQNKHQSHSPLYSQCQHGVREPWKWIHKGTEAFEKLYSLLTAKRLLNYISEISPQQQTYSVESFHAIINRFVPKSYAFSYHGIFARCAISALHYNENADNLQALTWSGELRWQVKHPKAKNGEATVS